MGDKEFEKLFNNNDDDQDIHEGVNLTCHHRLMFEVINNRTESITDMISSIANFLADINKANTKNLISNKTVNTAEDFLNSLITQAKVSIDQTDYLISRIIDELDPDDNEDNEDEPKL
jgi:hypothetical protein